MCEFRSMCDGVDSQTEQRGSVTRRYASSY